MNAKIRQIIEQVERFMGTVDDGLALPREAAAFAYALVLASRSQHAVEIGTSYGYSGLWIGAALAQNHGSLITIDYDSRKSDEAKSNFMAAELGAIVDVRTGRALNVLADVPGPIDFVLNDADKENCHKYVEILLPKLAQRAIILTDNTMTHATELTPFLNWMKRRPDFANAILPVGNGILMSVKLPPDD